MAPEAVMTVGGLVIRPERRHKQPGVAQHIKHRVSPDPDALSSQRLSKHAMQLARAHARLSQPPLTHQIHDRLRFRLQRCLTAARLVVSLTAYAHVSASPADAQPLDEVLLEDLPEGFFTTRTP